MGRRNYINLRELAEELDYLNALQEDYAEEQRAVAAGEYPMPSTPAEELTEEQCERLDALRGLEMQLGDLHVARRNGVRLIHEDDFEDEARERCPDDVDLGRWPYNCIDWTQAAEELKHDYSCIEFDGETYYTVDV